MTKENSKEQKSSLLNEGERRQNVECDNRRGYTSVVGRSRDRKEGNQTRKSDPVGNEPFDSYGGKLHM